MTQVIKVVRFDSAEFEPELAVLANRGDADLGRVDDAVRQIVTAVRREGDAALHRFVNQFEHRTVSELLTRDYGGAQALEALSRTTRNALEFAAGRIREFHEHQAEKLDTFEYAAGGVRLGTRVLPVRRAGVYAPGGKARYPSSVLMSAIPAAVAGVEDIIVASPDTAPEVRAACHLAGVTALLDCGGAHAIAALAYGTETVPKVDKIVGPGNLYVAAAKRLVYGEVDIDGIAGPSEILVVADDTAEPRVVAADLLSQAEHDEAAYPLLVTSSESLLEAVQVTLSEQLAALPRRAIAERSLAHNGYAFLVEDSRALVRVANALAVEHVSVQTGGARELASQIRAAGALFIGHATPEAAGDYVAGPSHVLPTGGAARFSSPLGVYHFVARTSLIEYEPSALAGHAEAITVLARVEGLEAHARAVEMRTRKA